MPVYVDSGPSLGESLLGGLDAYRTARRQKRQDQQFEDDLARKLAIQNAELAQQGIHLLGKNEALPFDVSQGFARQDSAAAMRALPQTAAGLGGSFVDPTVAPRAPIPTNGTPPIMPPVASPIPSRAAAGRQNIPGQGSFMDRMTAMVNGPSRGPRYERGNGYYIDNQPRFDREDAARNQKFADQFEQAMIAQMTRTPPTPIQAMVGGKRTYVSPEQAIGMEAPSPEGGSPLETIVGPDGKPRLVSRASAINQTPFIKPPAPDRVLVQTMGPDGPVLTPRPQAAGMAPVVGSGNSGGLGGMGSGGIGGLARTSGAITGMGVAHDQMTPFENAILSGKAKYDGLDYFKGLYAKMYGAEGVVDKAAHSAAFAQLDRQNPQLANYLRAAETWALEDSQLSGKASDFRTKMDNFVSEIGPNFSPELIANTQHFRQTRLDELRKFQPAMQSMAERITGGRGGRGTAGAAVSPPSPNDPGGNIDLSNDINAAHVPTIDEMIRTGKSDAEIKAALSGARLDSIAPKPASAGGRSLPRGRP